MADADVRRMFDLIFFAVLSVIRAVLPGMRARSLPDPRIHRLRR